MVERLKITGMRTHAVGAGWRNYVYVEIETDRGIVGLGEATLEGQTGGVLGVLRDLEPVVLGKDPFRIEHLWQEIYRHSFWRGGPTLLSALSGIEMALWDIKGKALGVPVYQLIGGKVRDRIRVYANGPRGDTPETVARSARDLVDRGFTALKWSPFAATPLVAGKALLTSAIAQVRAVREAVGPDVDLMIDAHGRLSPAMAIRAAAALNEFRIFFLEEPCLPENVDAMARVAAKSRIPIATGERLFTRFGFREVLEKRGAAVLQPDLAHAGGIYEVRKIAAMAEMYFASVAPHNPLSWVNTVASLHVDAATPNFLIQELVADTEPWRDDVVNPVPTLDEGGYLSVPEGPGLGIELNHAALGRFPPSSSRLPVLWHVDGAVADW